MASDGNGRGGLLTAGGVLSIVGGTYQIIGGLLLAAIIADSKALVVPVNTAGSVVTTAKNAGTFGNTIGMKVEGSVGGITVAITVMSAGATDPVLTGVLDVLGDDDASKEVDGAKALLLAS